MQTELDVLRDVSTKLSRAGIEYMLTGSFALNYYAEPRMTRDIDIVVALEPNDADLVVELFEPEYYVPRDSIRRAIVNESLFNIIHSEGIIKIDLIVRKSGEYRRIEFDRRSEVEVDGTKIWIVSKEDLIISKLYWAKDSRSEFQLRDVKNLLASGYDAVYLKEWVEKLGLNRLLKECLDE
jgi:predicted nucleotidyltransferase